MPFSRLVQEIEASPEAEQRRQCLQGNLVDFINTVYREFLGHPPEPAGLQDHLAAFRRGMSYAQLVDEVQANPEAIKHRSSLKDLKALSDGDFILNMYELFEGRAALPQEIERWRKFLANDPTKRSELVLGFFNAHAARQRRDQDVRWNSGQTLIMGTRRHLNLAAWRERATRLNIVTRPEAAMPARARRAFEHSGEYVVSAIASLYRGRKYLERFLDNITTQTIFDRSELIIVDADSPEGEEKVIAEYQKDYPNIVYKRMNCRIGIYDAWNVGVQVARGRYLTSTNLDDLRRDDSFELQAHALDRNLSADVVYQDFVYTCDASLSFEDIARLDFKSELPIITKQNLMAFNSPHNAPMWRKSLHDEIGLFDTSFKSAGDWEFWLRCIWKGKSFCKINTPHVAYFINPDGISTNPNTRGIEEAKIISRRYGRKLISPHLLETRQAFAEAFGIIQGGGWNLSFYDFAQNHMKRLADLHRSGADLSNLEEVWNLSHKHAFGPPFVPGEEFKLQDTFPVQISTSAVPWAYGVLFPLRMKDLRGPLLIRIQASVHGGPIGVGILNPQANDFVCRTSVVAPGNTTLNFRVPEPQPIGDLVIQTWAEGKPAAVRVDAITVLGPRIPIAQQ